MQLRRAKETQDGKEWMNTCMDTIPLLIVTCTIYATYSNLGVYITCLSTAQQ